MKKIISTLFVVLLCVKAFSSGHTVTISAANATCNGVCNGTATATVSGGVGPFVYSWVPNGGTAAIATNLCTGSYTVTVTDINDMSTATATLVISEPPLLTATASSTTTSSCGACDGTATLGASGGTPPYQYTWSPGGIMTLTMTGLCSGSYTITITDSQGCISNATTTVSSIALLITNPAPICSPGTVDITDAAVTAGSIGGGTLTYWTDPAATMALNSPSAVSISGTYYIKSVAGTCVDIKPVVVTIYPLPFIVVTNPATICAPGTVDITNTFTGPTNQVFSFYYDSTAVIPISIPTMIITSGTYYILATNFGGCQRIFPVIVTINPIIHADFTMVPDSTNGLNYYAFNSTTGNGLIYNWDFGDGGSSTLQSPTHLYSSTGTYTVSLVATTPNGCLESVSHTITVNATPASCLSLFNIAFDTNSTDPYAYTVYNLSYGSTLSYLWSFGDGTSSALQNPTHVYGGGGPYQLCLTVDNGSGCTQTSCDSLIYVDSLSRTTNQLSITVVDVAAPLVTSILKQPINSSVEVYPNPFSDNTTFVIQSAKATEKYTFELIDVLGKKVRSMNEISAKQFTVSRNGLENGIYFYKIYSAENLVGIGKLIAN